MITISIQRTFLFNTRHQKHKHSSLPCLIPPATPRHACHVFPYPSECPPRQKPQRVDHTVHAFILSFPPSLVQISKSTSQSHLTSHFLHTLSHIFSEIKKKIKNKKEKNNKNKNVTLPYLLRVLFNDTLWLVCCCCCCLVRYRGSFSDPSPEPPQWGASSLASELATPPSRQPPQCLLLVPANPNPT